MQFGYTILYVQDVPGTIAFYETAFGFARRFVHEAGDYGELDTGATTLAFSSLALMRELGKNPQSASANAPSFEIALSTADVAAAVLRAVDAGARLVQPPEQMPWGQTVAYVTDINGALVELCTPVVPPTAA
jgi:lactoylglutathione lyase